MRIPNIKKGAKKIFITNEPGEALRLLGYDPLADIWQEEFESLDQMFQHTMKCRLFRGFYGMELTGEDGSIMAGKHSYSWSRARAVTD